MRALLYRIIKYKYFLEDIITYSEEKDESEGIDGVMRQPGGVAG